MTVHSGTLPDTIRDIDQLESLLGEPSAGAITTLASLDDDLLILGVGGKMGPTLARMARRAFDIAGVRRRVIGVSRFGQGDEENRLRAHGIETIRCDMLDVKQLRDLPEIANIVYMAGMKFGSTGQEARTWAMNSFLPGLVCQRFPRSRIVAFSTGNVYPLSLVVRGGAVESDSPGPIGEYAMSCLGRERVFEHFSRTQNQPMAILRLNYATELRYGVLVDLASKVFTGEPIDLAMGNANVIWQGDANAMALQALGCPATPPLVLNIAGPEIVSIRRLAEQFGLLLEREPIFRGEESPSALISNGQEAIRRFGYPRVGVGQMLHWVADWIRQGGSSLGKPTHFEVRDGRF